jgi:hypothetical protein
MLIAIHTLPLQTDCRGHSIVLYTGAKNISPSDTERQCPFCGTVVRRTAQVCQHCKESLPEVRVLQVTQAVVPARRKSSKVRRGLLYMLLAAVIQYFSGGYSALNFPFPINPLVTVCLAPLLFLSGFGLFVYGMVASNDA